jgi:diadenosine tetraphosphatase ApaH/serine/threonine PP2A family protein phosphatase
VTFAIVSDIHGNLTALDAVIRDLESRGISDVVQGGDLALIGARPAEVVDRVRELGWPGVVGNTDELLWSPEEAQRHLGAAPRLQSLLALLLEEYGPATRDLLGEERLRWLRELPAEHRRDGALVLHAAPGNLWRAPMADADDGELVETYGALGARLVVYGHIHRPFVRRLEGIVVANSGSVGLPWDGDPRASYLLVTDDLVEIARVAYDVEREVAALLRSGYPEGERIAAMLRRGLSQPP